MNLYYELLRYPVFQTEKVLSFFSSERTARNALGKLVKDNMVIKIRNGLYTCISGENGGPVANRFQIASAINATSYISHHTAFEYYGITDQVFYDVYVSSESRFQEFEFDGYTYHYVRSQIKAGVETPDFSGGIRISDKERTVIDSIKDLNSIAGLEEVITCILATGSLNEQKLQKYLSEYDSQFLYQKIGFILSEYKMELSISDDFIDYCKAKIGNSKRYITNGISDPVYAGAWNLIYPQNIKNMKNGDTTDVDI